MLSPASPEADVAISGVHSLAHTHSVSMSRFEGDPVRPSSKNLADIANHLPSPPPVYVPDRSPDAMKERRERKQAHRLMLHDNPKAFNRRKVRGSLSTFLEEGMAMKHLVGEVHQPRDHLNVCHPKAGYTYSRMTKDVSALAAAPCRLCVSETCFACAGGWPRVLRLRVLFRASTHGRLLPRPQSIVGRFAEPGQPQLSPEPWIAHTVQHAQRSGHVHYCEQEGAGEILWSLPRKKKVACV